MSRSKAIITKLLEAKRKLKSSTGSTPRCYHDYTEWRNAKGKLHRLDGPARENADGTKAWYVDGKLHRLDGPAIEYADGYKAWYVNGELHRLDGPAREWADGSKEWWVAGEHLEDVHSDVDFLPYQLGCAL